MGIGEEGKPISYLFLNFFFFFFKAGSLLVHVIYYECVYKYKSALSLSLSLTSRAKVVKTSLTWGLLKYCERPNVVPFCYLLRVRAQPNGDNSYSPFSCFFFIIGLTMACFKSKKKGKNLSHFFFRARHHLKKK